MSRGYAETTWPSAASATRCSAASTPPSRARSRRASCTDQPRPLLVDDVPPAPRWLRRSLCSWWWWLRRSRYSLVVEEVALLVVVVEEVALRPSRNHPG